MTISIARHATSFVATALIAGLALAGCAPATPAAPMPTAKDVWIKAVPKLSDGDMTGMFGTFSNDTDAVIYLTGGTATDSSVTATKLDAHEVVKDANGKMVMQEVKSGIPIPAHGSVTLKPGSYHVMFWNLKKPILAGDKVGATLTFSNGTRLDVTAVARDISNYPG